MSDSAYNSKLSQMQEYVPFLEKMIGKLERAGDKSKDPQLAKMKSLLNILTDKNKQLKMDTLIKCEDVLEKLYEKVEGTSLKGGKIEVRDEKRHSGDKDTRRKESGGNRRHQDNYKRQGSDGGSGSNRDSGVNQNRTVWKGNQNRPSNNSAPGPWNRGPSSNWPNTQNPPPQFINPWRDGMPPRPNFNNAHSFGNHFDNNMGYQQRFPSDGGFQQGTNMMRPESFEQNRYDRNSRNDGHNNSERSRSDGGFGGSRFNHDNRFDRRHNFRGRFNDDQRRHIDQRLDRHERSNSQDKRNSFSDDNNRVHWSNNDQSQQHRDHFNRNQSERLSFDRFEGNRSRHDNFNRSNENYKKQFYKNQPDHRSHHSQFSSSELRSQSPNIGRNQNLERKLQSPGSTRTRSLENSQSVKGEKNREGTKNETESPASPSGMETPMSPVENTPKSPCSGPSSPDAPVEPKVIPLEKPKVIPLERKDSNSRPDVPKRPLMSSLPLPNVDLPTQSDIKSRLKQESETLHALGGPSHKKMESLKDEGRIKHPTSNEVKKSCPTPSPLRGGPGLLPTPPGPRFSVPMGTNLPHHSMQKFQHPPPQNSQRPVNQSHHFVHPPEQKKPLTYGEYRKMKEERERQHREYIKRFEEAQRKSNEALSESTSKHSFGPSDETSTNPDPSTITNFKIPKKKRPSSDDGSDSSKQSIEDLKSPTRTGTARESDADSEPELKIITDHDNDKANDSNSDMEMNSEENTDKKIKDVNDSEEKSDRTKDILQNILASLEPEEAAKLMKKVNAMEKSEKLNLKQLKFLLAEVDQDDEIKEDKDEKKNDKNKELEGEESVQSSNKNSNVMSRKTAGTTKTKGAKTSKSNKTLKAPTTPGTRRSTRLNNQEREKEVSSDEDDDEDDQLVIDEETMKTKLVTNLSKEDLEVEKAKEVMMEEKIEENELTNSKPTVKRGRGRPSKRGKQVLVSKGDSIQDNSVSSSNQKSEDNDKVQPQLVSNVQVKQEIEDEPFEPLVLQNRPGKQRMLRMAPKSKTWFPGARGGGTSSRNRRTASPHEQDQAILPKKEPKDPDLKVFIGSESISLENEFKTKEAVIDQDIAKSVKNRISALSGLIYKLKGAEKIEETPSEVESKAQSGNKSDSEIKKDEDLGPFIITERVTEYRDKMSSMIDELKKEITEIPAESEDLKRPSSEKRSLLGLIHEWKYDPLDQGKDDKESVHLDNYTRHKLSINQCAPANQKSEEAIKSQLSESCIGHLFKCFSKNCPFTTNDATYFKFHLDNHTENEQKGCKKCVYCNANFISSEKLIYHVIAIHGSNCYQCPHCYHRTGSKVALLIHLQSLHPGEKQGFIRCKSLGSDHISESPSTLLPIHCAECRMQCKNESEFYYHVTKAHAKSSKLQSLTEIVCWYCGSVFKSIVPLVLHSTIMHTSQPIVCGLRHIDVYERKVRELEEDTFSSEEWEDESSSDEETKVNNQDYLNGDEPKETGLIGRKLYKCGNEKCSFSAEHVGEFRDHLFNCEHVIDQTNLKCFHCSKTFKHVPTLLEHLKSHGVKRYYCSLCSYKAALSANAKSHIQSSHKVSNVKLIALDPKKTNPDTDQFLVAAKHSLPRGIRAAGQVGGKPKDTYGPEEIDSIPKMSMFKQFIRCSECDFSTKVRQNMLKHLTLHRRYAEKSEKFPDKSNNNDNAKPPTPPPITPINPPSTDEVTAASKMTSLIDADSEEERAKRPLSAEELALMPKLVPENLRFACSEFDCQHMTIDTVMLLYHIQAIHPNVQYYNCPHCQQSENRQIEFDDLEFHLRCHGDLLFRCGHCRYYHWQKRTAEKHVADNHTNRKQYVRNVRVEEEILANQTKKQKKQKELLSSDLVSAAPPPPQYQPYKCGLCEFAHIDLDGIKTHIRDVHQLENQFKCSLCDLSSDRKTELESHFSDKHPSQTVCFIKVYFIDPSPAVLDSAFEEKQEPLWSRNMPGVKHIRGILYEENPTITPSSNVRKKSVFGGKTFSGSTSGSKVELKKSKLDQEKTQDEVDNFPMECKECGIKKKTVKGLKMHIKLLHLRTGKFRCNRCMFSANILNSIHTHYKIKHPEVPTDKVDFEERNDDSMVFSHEYWKSEWKIPTLDERKAIVSKRKREEAEIDNDVIFTPERPVGRPKMVKRGKKQAQKRKHPVKTQNSEIMIKDLEVLSPSDQLSETKRKEILESVSPFEMTPTYKCNWCPKTTQMLDRMERHVNENHSSCLTDGAESNYKVLTRDQVVDMLTINPSNQANYVCFYCDDVAGSIHELKDHFDVQHVDDTFKVKSSLGFKGCGGYLECQLCGHLTSGFERSKQKVHFHEEHPLETNVNASKYVLKGKANSFIEQGNNKIDLSQFNGQIMKCPKDNCNFEAKSLSAINNHLRRHTQTFKCGHCGKTHTSSSEFHQHSAMMHGDKIPDQVKDPEAEAELDALKGLLEVSLLEQAKPTTGVKRKKQSVAKKSTSQRRTRPTARKSTSAINRVIEPFSFYRKTVEPINYEAISTVMSFGGIEMNLKANKMSELINLHPKVFVVDCNQADQGKQGIQRAKF